MKQNRGFVWFNEQKHMFPIYLGPENSRKNNLFNPNINTYEIKINNLNLWSKVKVTETCMQKFIMS